MSDSGQPKRSIEPSRRGRGKKRVQLITTHLQEIQLPPIIPVNPLQPRNVSSNTSASESMEATLQPHNTSQSMPIPQPQRIPTQPSHPTPSMHASPTDTLHSPMQASPPTPDTSSSHIGGDMTNERIEIKPLADG